MAISAAPHGRLRLDWFDTGSGKIHLVQTGATGSGFGAASAIGQPGPAFIFDQLQIEGSAGRLDLIVNVTVTKPTTRQELWHIQVP